MLSRLCELPSLSNGFSYSGLAFHIVDSRSYGNFCRIGITHKGFKKSALCKNIKAISPQTWESINNILVDYSKDKKIEKGRESRIDCTVVSSNIHKPFDSGLLWDSVRVLTRMLKQVKEQFEDIQLQFTDHSKRAKRRMLGVMNAKNKKARKKPYVDLLKVALDGGFASKGNLESAKGKGIKDVCFSKKCGLEVDQMCRSEYVYKRLRRFRAGIESAISWIKRCFGFDRCTWKSPRSFKSYVWASVVSANLVTIARSNSS